MQLFCEIKYSFNLHVFAYFILYVYKKNVDYVYSTNLNIFITILNFWYLSKYFLE